MSNQISRIIYQISLLRAAAAAASAPLIVSPPAAHPPAPQATRGAGSALHQSSCGASLTHGRYAASSSSSFSLACQLTCSTDGLFSSCCWSTCIPDCHGRHPAAAARRLQRRARLLSSLDRRWSRPAGAAHHQQADVHTALIARVLLLLHHAGALLRPILSIIIILQASSQLTVDNSLHEPRSE